MKIKIVDGELKVGSLYLIILIGYFIGGTCFALPLVLLSILIDPEAPVLLTLAVTPAVTIIQGAITSGFIILGIFILKKFKPELVDHKPYA